MCAVDVELKKLVRRGSSLCLCLGTFGKVRAHVTLKVEVGELIILLKLEQCAKLAVGKNAATVLWVLKLVGSNIGINLTSDLSTGHLGAMWLSEELSKLFANLGRLYKSTGSTVSSLAGALATCLLGILKLTLRTFLKCAYLSSDTSKLGSKDCKLSQKLLKGVRKGRNGIRQVGQLQRLSQQEQLVASLTQVVLAWQR